MFHALTGCDTTSSFYGKGKKIAYNIVKANNNHISALEMLGNSFSTDHVPAAIERLVCSMYNTAVNSIDEARYEVFKTGSSEKSLPPNHDALKMHIKRVNYQSRIWRLALAPIVQCPGPSGNGWTLTEEGLTTVQWLEGPYAPKDILKTTKCGCKTTACKGGRCACLKSAQLCAAALAVRTTGCRHRE
jgi:hypothetical protein